MQSHQSERLTLRVKDAVATSGICKTKVYDLINAGTLKTVKIGSALLTPSEAA
jgi:predicted DNA-binding transcriptional regulator AlpA